MQHTDFCIRTKIVCVNGLKFKLYAIWSKNLSMFQIFKTENDLLDYMKRVPHPSEYLTAK